MIYAGEIAMMYADDWRALGFQSVAVISGQGAIIDGIVYDAREQVLLP